MGMQIPEDKLDLAKDLGYSSVFTTEENLDIALASIRDATMGTAVSVLVMILLNTYIATLLRDYHVVPRTPEDNSSDG